MLVVSIGNLFGQASLVGKKFQPNLKSTVYQNESSKTYHEFSKDVVVVRFIDPENVRVEFELDVWKNFINAVDTTLVGFVFYSAKKNGKFQEQWEGARVSAPLIVDEVGLISRTNGLPDDPTVHTLILNKNLDILTQAGSPIVSDNFNAFRNSIAKELQLQGYDRGVTGVIVDPTANNRSWFMGTPVYLLPNGETVVAEDAMKRIVDRTVYPQYSPLSDTVRLIKLR